MLEGGCNGSCSSAEWQATTTQFEVGFEVQGEILGSGASGFVRPAICRRTGHRFAVKTFKKDELSPSANANMRREIDIHLSLDHPHIVRLEQVYECHDEVHLVMELLDGGDVFELLEERGQFTEEQVASIMRQILDAVAYLHERGITHRDLKLENVLRKSKDSQCVKLIDFGFATPVGEKALTNRCGTLQYVAPEVLHGQYTQNADLWSLGVMAYMLLTGKALYNGDEDTVKKSIKSGRPHWSRNFDCISEGAKNFVNSFLIADPCQRLSAADGRRHPWLTEYIDAGAGLEKAWASTEFSHTFSSTPCSNTLEVVASAKNQVYIRPREDEAKEALDCCDINVGKLFSDSMKVSCFFSLRRILSLDFATIWHDVESQPC